MIFPEGDPDFDGNCMEFVRSDPAEENFDGQSDFFWVFFWGGFSFCRTGGRGGRQNILFSDLRIG